MQQQSYSPDPPRREMIVIIAAGVFAGVFVSAMAALGLYSFPGWLRERQEQQGELRAAERYRWLYHMSPTDFPARCGELAIDQTTDYANIAYRTVIVETHDYTGKTESVTAEYTRFGGTKEWVLTGMPPHDIASEDGRNILFGTYPCLDKFSLTAQPRGEKGR